MSRRLARLEVESLVEPLASPVVDSDTEVTVLLRLRLEVQPESHPVPAHLALVAMGTPTSVPTWSTAVTEALGALRAGDRLSLPGGRTVAIEGDGSREAVAQAVQEALARPVETVAAALHQGREALLADHRAEVAHRLLFVGHSPIVEPVEPLLAAASALSEKQIGLDVVSTSPHIDLGMMIRLANLGGGEVNFVDSVDALKMALLRRVERVTSQYFVDLRLELEFVPGVVPGRMYRLAPSPVFLGNVRLTPTDRRLVLDPGPVTPGHEPSFVLTLVVPRRRLGHYRVIEVTARYRASHRTHTAWQGSIMHSATDDPLASGSVEASVIAARDRVEPAGWIEEAARAFLEGDHRRVATTLERMARRFLEQGRTADAHATVESRARYLRTGHLDRNELNKLRRLASL